MHHPKRRTESPLVAVVPALITGGPLFIALSRSSASPPTSTLELVLHLCGYAGALGLALGLVVLFRMLVRQQREIDVLRQQLGGS